MTGRHGPLLGALAIALLVMVPGTVLGQVTFDAQAYRAAIEEGQAYYDEASELPAEAAAQRRELLADSVIAKMRAREMLRLGLIQGAVDDFREDAINELFNLTDNVIVTLMELDQCDAAEILLAQVSRETTLRPPDADPHLDTLANDVQACRERLAADVADWDAAYYAQNVADADSFRERADGQRDEQVAEGLRFDALEAERLALEALRVALLSDDVRVTGVDDPNGRLESHYDSLIERSVALGLCEAAERRQLERDRDLELLGAGPGNEDHSEAVQECLRDRETALHVAEISEPVVTEPIVQVVEADRNPWPYFLIGTAGAATVAAILIDLTLIGDRNDFDDLKARCQEGVSVANCNFEALQTLSDSIDRQRITIWTLAGVAVVSGTAGIIWLVMDNNADEAARPSARFELSPTLSPGVYGAAVTFTH